MSRSIFTPARAGQDMAMKPIGALLSAVVAGIAAPPEGLADSEQGHQGPLEDPVRVATVVAEQAVPDTYAPFVPGPADAAEPFAEPPQQLAFDL